MDLGLMDMGKMSLGTMDLGFGNNGVGIHGVAVMLIFNPGSDLDGNAIGCTWGFAYDTRALHLRPDIFCFWERHVHNKG